MTHDYVPPLSNGGTAPGSPRNNINGVKNRNVSWTSQQTNERMTFTMRREIDKAKEENELINQLRNVRIIKKTLILS